MKNIIFKISALVIVLFSSCSPKFGRIITNNNEFSSTSIINRPNIDDTVKQNNKQEGLAINVSEDFHVSKNSASPIEVSLNNSILGKKNSDFIYRSQYRPEIIRPKAAIPNNTATVLSLGNKFYDQDNQLAYITLGLLSLGLIALNMKKLKKKLSENSI